VQQALSNFKGDKWAVAAFRTAAFLNSSTQPKMRRISTIT
jgi:hypothetical protein